MPSAELQELIELADVARLLVSIDASIDRHFRAGNPTLTKIQLDQHKASNTCTECQERAAKAGIRPVPPTQR